MFVSARPRLGSHPLDYLRSRLGLFRGHAHPYFETNNDAPMPDGAGPIERAFYGHDGRTVHKWHHYLPLYDRYLGSYRQLGRPVRILEIGVSEGGSLELWRGYFGAGAVIFGIDRFMSEIRGFTNLIGNAVATLVVAKWEGALDREKAKEILR